MYSECLLDVASPLVEHVLACYMPCALSVIGHVLVRKAVGHLMGYMDHYSLWHVSIPLVRVCMKLTSCKVCGSHILWLLWPICMLGSGYFRTCRFLLYVWLRGEAPCLS